MTRPNRRPAAEPSHVAARRRQEDTARTQRRARENVLIHRHDRARKNIAKAEARRDADLGRLKERMRRVRDTAATTITEARKEIVAVVTELKKDHTAEEGAPLLGLTVEQFNKILYNGRIHSTPTEADDAEQGSAAETETSGSTATTPRSHPGDEDPSPQITLSFESDPAASPSPTATPDHPEPVNNSIPEEAPPDTTTTEATEP